MKQHNILITSLLVCISSIFIQAQTTNKVPRFWDDQSRPLEVRFDSLYSYALQVQTQINGDSFLTLANQAIVLAEQINTPRKLFDAKFLYAVSFHLLDSTFKSIQLLEDITSEFKNQDILTTVDSVNIYSCLITNYHTFGNYNNVTKYLIKVNMLLERLKESPYFLYSKIMNLSNLCAIHIDIKDFETALTYGLQANRLLESYNGKHALAAFLSLQVNLIELYSQKGDLDMASSQGTLVFEHLFKSPNPFPVPHAYYQDSLTLKEKNTLLFIYGNFIEVSYAQKRYAVARQCFKDFEVLAQIDNGAFHKTKAELWKGKLALVSGNLSQSETACLASLKIAEQNHLTEQERDALYCLYESNVSQGNYKDAINYLQQYHNKADSLISESKIREIEQLKSQIKFENFSSTVRQEQSIQAAKLRQQYIINYSIGLILLIATVAGWFLLKSYRKIKQLNQRLTTLNTRIEYMVHSVSHDILSNLNLAISTGNFLLHQEETNINNSIYPQQVQRTLQELKTYATQLLRSPFLSDYTALRYKTDLESIFRETRTRYQEIINTKKLKIEAPVLPYVNIPEYVARQLFENLISNTLRHGLQHPNPHINVFIEYIDDSCIKLIWEDNGTCFIAPPSNSEPKKDSGLYLLRQTLAEYKINMILNVTATGGARVELIIPSA